jgi:hypothetical protein
MPQEGTSAQSRMKGYLAGVGHRSPPYGFSAAMVDDSYDAGVATA